MITLGQIERSEYNLLGAMSEEEFLAALETAPQGEKRRMFRRMQHHSAASAQNAPATVYGDFLREQRGVAD